MGIYGTNNFLAYLNYANHKLAKKHNPKGKDMNKKEPHIDSSKVKDLATEAAIKSLMPKDRKPTQKERKTQTQRWLESQSDCA